VYYGGVRKTRATAISLVIALLHFSATALAQQSAPFSLEWASPVGCGSSDEVRRRAESLLGGPIEPRLRHALSARGTVTADNGHFSLQLDTVDDGLPGQRHLESASCDELVSATALIVALAVDPKTVASRTGTNAANEEPATTPPAATAPPPAVASPPARAASPSGATSQRALRVTGYLDAGIATDLGALPAFAIGPTLSGAVGIERLRLRLGATYFAPRFADSLDATSHGERGADVSLLVGTLSGCYVLVQRTEVSACADFEGGALFAAGTGFSEPRDATIAWYAAGASVDLLVALIGPLTLRAGLGAMFPFGRSHVQFQGDVGDIHVLHQPFWVSGRGTLALGIAFW
jgi:hypothetical protein